MTIETIGELKLSNTKKIARNVGFLYVRMFLIMAVTLYTSRVVLNTLGESDYGIYNVVGGIVIMIAFLNSAMATATQRYLSYDIGRADLQQLQKTFSATLTIHYIIGFLVIVIGEPIGLWYINAKMVFPVERSLAVNVVFQMSLLTLFLDIIQSPYNALILAKEKMNIYAYVSILEAGLKLLIAFALLWFGTDKLILYAVLTFFLASIIRLIYKNYCKRNFIESKYTFEYNRGYFAELISFSGWSLFGTMSLLAKNQGVNMILNLFFGTIINASYGIAMQVQGAVTQFVANFQTALNPQIIQNYAAGNKEKSISLIFLGAKFSFMIMMILVFPIIFNIDRILGIWLGQAPEYTALFVKMSLITILIDSLSGPLMTGILATGKIKHYNVLIGSFNILTLPSCYIFFRMGNSPEVAFQILLLFSILSFMLRLYLVKKEFNIQLLDFFKKVFIRAVFSAGTVAAGIYWMSQHKFFHDNIVINIPLIITGSVVVIYFFGVTDSERKSILLMLNDKISKIHVN